MPVVSCEPGKLAGTATIRRDGGKLCVTVTADHEIEVELLRLPPIGKADPGPVWTETPGLLLIALFADRPTSPSVVRAKFDLSQTHRNLLNSADLALLSGLELAAIDHNAVAGLGATDGPIASDMRLLPVDARPNLRPEASAAEVLARAKAIRDRAYYQRRMLQEIEAALRADQTEVVSKHVHLANLLAQRIQPSMPAEFLNAN